MQKVKKRISVTFDEPVGEDADSLRRAISSYAGAQRRLEAKTQVAIRTLGEAEKAARVKLEQFLRDAGPSFEGLAEIYTLRENESGETAQALAAKLEKLDAFVRATTDPVLFVHFHDIRSAQLGRGQLTMGEFSGGGLELE